MEALMTAVALYVIIPVLCIAIKVIGWSVVKGNVCGGIKAVIDEFKEEKETIEQIDNEL